VTLLSNGLLVLRSASDRGDPFAPRRRTICTVTAPHARRRIAIACIVAALAGQIVLPGLHAIVHRLEAAAAGATQEKRWRVKPSKVARRDSDRRDHGHDHPHDHRKGEHHHHPGDERGGHGSNAPEHLTFMLVAAAPAVVPPSYQLAASVELERHVASIALAPGPSRRHNRGPPLVG